MLRIIILLSTALVIGGCSQNSIKIKLDAINTVDYSNAEQAYFLLSGDPDINDNDLYFQEFSRLAHQALSQAGIRRAEDKESSSIQIYFSFGVNGETSKRYTYSTPVYAVTGGETLSIQERKVINGVSDTTNTDIYIPYRQRVIGSEQHTQTVTTYQSYLRLEGRDNDQRATQRWMITLESMSTGDDLRQLIPIMLSKAIPYIGKNSGKVIHLRVKSNDKQTLEFLEKANQ